ncbi:MAG: T9SS type A sorting domain-containing protein, partial [Chitinophagaceae bacterium]|nr:T9SS type A sorting domain-containing protein [Chitinophagaceae bacterium]
ELGLSDLTAYDFAYWPNPVTDMLNITSQKPVESVSVYNLVGQKVIDGIVLTNGQIDMSSLAPGAYVFRVILEGNKVETFKIIKK